MVKNIATVIVVVTPAAVDVVAIYVLRDIMVVEELWQRRQWSYLKIYMMDADISDDDSSDYKYQFDGCKMIDKKCMGVVEVDEVMVITILMIIVMLIMVMTMKFGPCCRHLRRRPRLIPCPFPRPRSSFSSSSSSLLSSSSSSLSYFSSSCLSSSSSSFSSSSSSSTSSSSSYSTTSSFSSSSFSA
ncbi:hypothetical protein DPMN_077243 [Dreissena polymorpha]|uniref:Uncharacterized protein n=1 Tax=Dreissena polymorpha TaxID=45954 RepID=A0A9D3YN44_DREPO|nr:hypothetical protein DPMN_077243 [Dreissena polymorpha]